MSFNNMETVIQDFEIYKKFLKKKKADFKISNQYLSENQLIKIINNYDAIICGDDKITNKVIKKAKN